MVSFYDYIYVFRFSDCVCVCKKERIYSMSNPIAFSSFSSPFLPPLFILVPACLSWPWHRRTRQTMKSSWQHTVTQQYSHRSGFHIPPVQFVSSNNIVENYHHTTTLPVTLISRCFPPLRMLLRIQNCLEIESVGSCCRSHIFDNLCCDSKLHWETHWGGEDGSLQYSVTVIQRIKKFSA